MFHSVHGNHYLKCFYCNYFSHLALPYCLRITKLYFDTCDYLYLWSIVFKTWQSAGVIWQVSYDVTYLGEVLYYTSFIRVCECLYVTRVGDLRSQEEVTKVRKRWMHGKVWEGEILRLVKGVFCRLSFVSVCHASFVDPM